MTERALDIDQLITADWRLHGSVYRSEEVFEAEMERIFSRTWVFVGHESEVAEPGDYKTTTIGRQPVILCRGADDGAVRVLMNRCRHRGATVCQGRTGTANYFRCSYHGWTYHNNGKLVGVPFEDGYGAGFDKESLGLVSAPRVASHQGFVFASLSPEGISLREHLGPALEYLDFIAALGPDGVTFDGGVQRMAYDGDWKLQLENTIDIYHFNFVHRTYLKLLEKRSGEKSEFVKQVRSNEGWTTLDLGHGHSAHDYGQWRDAGGTDGKGPGIAIGNIPFNLIVFPNLGFVGAQARVILPVDVNRTEVEIYPMLLAGADEAVNRKLLQDHEGFYGPASFGLPDDLEVGFERVERGLQAKVDDWVVMQRGMDMEKDRGDGVLVGRSADEVPQRAFYRAWKALMGAPGTSGEE